jgi:iron-sulfur cluster assembly protein
MAGLKIVSDTPPPAELPPFEVRPSVADGARRLFAEKSAPEGAALRVGVRGGGCSGLSYVVDVETAPPRETDRVYDLGTVKVLVDPRSLKVLEGCTLEFKLGLMDAGFRFDNPRATKVCGCGESFSLG